MFVDALSAQEQRRLPHVRIVLHRCVAVGGNETPAVRALRVGVVGVNNYSEGDVFTPFGGFKQSGFGVEFGAEGLKEFTTIQTVLS